MTSEQFLFFSVTCPGNQSADRWESLPGVQSSLWNNTHHWFRKDSWVKHTCSQCLTAITLNLTDIEITVDGTKSVVPEDPGFFGKIIIIITIDRNF